MKALFIGRFQPFHNGHLKVLQQIHKEFDEIIIGIGSSQYSHIKDNPFTYEERHTMITQALHEAHITKFSIIPIPDIHDPPNWVAHVTKLTPHFDIVIANNTFTRHLFEQKGYKTQTTPEFNRNQLSGKQIRKLLSQNNQWKNLVPPAVKNYLTSINATQRIKNPT